MDNKNVFVAIALSMSVLLFWGAFFETPKQSDIKNSAKQLEKNQENVITPNVNETQVVKKISRNDSINPDSIERLTTILEVLCASLKGQYDGWSTEVKALE